MLELSGHIVGLDGRRLESGLPDGEGMDATLDVDGLPPYSDGHNYEWRIFQDELGDWYMYNPAQRWPGSGPIHHPLIVEMSGNEFRFEIPLGPTGVRDGVYTLQLLPDSTASRGSVTGPFGHPAWLSDSAQSSGASTPSAIPDASPPTTPGSEDLARNASTPRFSNVKAEVQGDMLELSGHIVGLREHPELGALPDGFGRLAAGLDVDGRPPYADGNIWEWIVFFQESLGGWNVYGPYVFTPQGGFAIYRISAVLDGNGFRFEIPLGPIGARDGTYRIWFLPDASSGHTSVMGVFGHPAWLSGPAQSTGASTLSSRPASSNSERSGATP